MPVSDKIERLVAVAFRNMEATTNFRCMNEREKSALREMIVNLASVITAGDDQSEVLVELRELKSMVGSLCVRPVAAAVVPGTAPVLLSVSSAQDLNALAEFFLKGAVKSNLDDVKMEEGRSEGVENTVERLRKLSK